MGVSPFGNPRIKAHLQLPVAYRSLSRPSSAPDAKAFTLRSNSLELLYRSLIYAVLFELLEFHKQILSGFISQLKGFPFTCFESFPPFGEIVFTHFWKDQIFFDYC